MPSEKHISLELPQNSLVNCFSIQPILVKNEIPNRISLFSLNRYTKWRDDATTNNVFYVPKIYKGVDAKRIYDKAINKELLELYSLNVLLNTSLHVKVNASLKDLQLDKNKLRKLLLYYSELLKYKNRLNKGNIFITSDDLIFENIKFAAKQLNKFKKYKVDKDLLEENLIIIAAKGYVNFDNPIVAAPFIDSSEYNLFLKDIPNYNKSFKSTSSWPVMNQMIHEYENYQKFINEKMPLKWHFEKFLYPEMYYITLHLNP